MKRSGKFDRFRGISLKLALWTLVLLSLITAGISLVLTDTMDGVLLRELMRRGLAISRSAATPAAFSILANDRLALDNLAAKIGEGQDDLVFLAIVDSRGTILAHSRIGESGGVFQPMPGELVHQEGEFTVHRGTLAGGDFFEFRNPVLFAGKRVGDVYLRLSADSLEASRRQARHKILLIAAGALLLGTVGTFLLAGILTRPIKRLSQGVSILRTGGCTAVPVSSRDELGRLTREFNAMAEELMRQKTSLADHARQLEEAYLSTVRLLAAAIDARDEYTLGHSTRVANLALLVGRRLGFDEEELRELAVACFLHDVGKIRIPDRILNKRGPLNRSEHACIVRHAEHGADILRLSESLHRYVPAVLHHHEHWDGSGYPAGLKGEQIPHLAAILAIADAYDAMTSSRPYRAGLSRAEAVEEILRCSGSQFAPDLVKVFLLALEDYRDEHLPSTIAGVA